MSLREKINTLGAAKIPFVFCVDYDKKGGFVYPSNELPEYIKIDMDNLSAKSKTASVHIPNQTPIDIDEYKKKIEALKKHIRDGDIYLANLTCETKIELKTSLLNIFEKSGARFKLFFKDKFVVQSPEEFVNIKDGVISAYPMKGTAVYKGDESIERLLQDKKELAEHTMIVDLLRNDLSIVSSGVTVQKFRQPIVIEAGDKKLIQTISHISGRLDSVFENRLGDTIFSLLPAGSITGTPKKKCVEILKQIEGYERGYYCGVFGEYDGYELKSAVAIRYIERTKNGFVYKSGGGITLDSDALLEYEEMKKKVYLAF